MDKKERLKPLAFGMLFGTALGVTLHNLALGIGLGVLVGGIIMLIRENKNRNKDK